MKYRILFVHHASVRGGAALSLLYLMRTLDNNEFECLVCNSEDDEEVPKLFERNLSKCYSCRLRRFAHTTGGFYNLVRPSGWRQLADWIRNYRSACLRLEKLLRDLQPDLVHFNSLTLAPYAHVPARMGIPNVVHVRESILQGTFGMRKKWLIRQLNQYASRVIAICQDNLDRLQLAAGRGQVIYNPIDFRKFDATIDKLQTREELGIPADAKVALFAGGSVPEAKGLFEFLEAMALVRSKNEKLICLMPSFKFAPSPKERQWTIKRRIGWLMGIYRKSDRLFRLTEKNDLKDRIIAGDFTYEIERWIAASDVVCAPHILPHFSRTVIEAGAMKRPVVAFRVGGIEEVVTHGANGLLVEVGDIKGFSDAVLKLFSNEDECVRLGENGWQQAQQLFAADKSAAMVAEVYQELLSRIRTTD